MIMYIAKVFVVVIVTIFHDHVTVMLCFVQFYRGFTVVPIARVV